MKVYPFVIIAAAVLFSSCGKEKVSSTDSEDVSVSPAIISEVNATGFNPALSNVVSHLDTHGAHLSVTHVDKDLTELASAADGLLDVARQTSDEVPANLSIVDLVDDLGLSKVVAMGRSARKDGGVWHNRMFLETGGRRTGVLSLLGGEGQAWKAQEIAPDDADLVLEFELNLRRMKQTLDLVTSSFGAEPEKEFLDAMKEKVADSALTLGDFLGKMDVRASLIVSLDSSKRWSPNESVELPYVDCALRIERGMWIWDNFGKMIEANAEVTEKEGLKIIKAPEDMETPMGKIRPLLILDKEKDLIWISLREDYLDQCRSAGGKLSGNRSYQAAIKGFPDKGNGLFFVSKDFCKEISIQVDKIKGHLPEGGEAAGAFGAVTGLLGDSLTLSDDGYAWSIANTGSGILVTSNSPFPDKGYGMAGSIAPIAALSAMATPVILKQQKKARTTEAVSNMKQMYYLFIEYDQDFDSFPKQLSSLVKEGYITEDSLIEINSCQVVGGRKPLSYISGFSTSDNTANIIMHTPQPIDGKRAFLRIDGAVKIVQEAEFKRLLEKQTRK